VDHGHVEHGFACLGQQLIILRSAAIAAKPAEGALHHPPFWQQEEALGPLGSFDNGQTDCSPGSQGPQPGDELTGIGLIRPDQPEAGKPGAADRQERHRAVAVLHTGGRHRHRQEQAERLDQDVAFTTVNVVVLVVAMAPPLSVVLTD
jgi:hypothetical protein